MNTLVAESPVVVPTHCAAAYFCRELARLKLQDAGQHPTILVAGCGAGHEAAYISDYFPATVEAIDIEHNPDPEFVGLPDVHFQAASVEDLPFEDESFDAIFYHHVIEHVRDPGQSLVELARVLRPGGWMFLGTPNRHRLLSAVGAYRQRDWSPSLRDKFRENWQDWSARFRGKFRNECGAHAGFATSELDALLARHFSERHWVTKEYLRCKYSEHRLGAAIQLATTAPLRWFMAPSIYVLCQK